MTYVGAPLRGFHYHLFDFLSLSFRFIHPLANLKSKMEQLILSGPSAAIMACFQTRKRVSRGKCQTK